MLHFLRNFSELLWNLPEFKFRRNITLKNFFYNFLFAPLTVRENDVSVSVILNDVGCVFWHFLWEFEYEDFLLL